MPLAQRLVEVRNRIATSAEACGRLASDVELVVITKNHEPQLVLDLIDLGERNFGENRDQEANPKSKWVAERSDEAITWHFVGQLQSNKVKSALEYATVIHSLDRQSLLSALIKSAIDAPKPVGVFVQLNLTEDAARGGIEPANLEHFANAVLESQNLYLLGVMGVAALDRDPRIDFETIAKASAQLQKISADSKYISAGMSHDFEAAIEFGATHLRIGTAITGNRSK
ncbi:YggS family pyridoxal phosphate-dependent enzyme [Rhodoluna sp.]|uniref:YggS family pyridoxal phosphate-dependent enzyme n=1 Tax=Rhodoluna sp. TaxID=1969481 RepID=UPI0025FCD0A6|nr:YggS family pyridoxal phosphate-dependent enzyme [Rhodoluna sp.]